MLPTKDQLQFKAGYRLKYSKAKKEEEDSGGLGEATPTNAPEGGDPKTNHAR